MRSNEGRAVGAEDYLMVKVELRETLMRYDWHEKVADAPRVQLRPALWIVFSTVLGFVSVSSAADLSPRLIGPRTILELQGTNRGSSAERAAIHRIAVNPEYEPTEGAAQTDRRRKDEGAAAIVTRFKRRMASPVVPAAAEAELAPNPEIVQTNGESNAASSEMQPPPSDEGVEPPGMASVSDLEEFPVELEALPPELPEDAALEEIDSEATDSEEIGQALPVAASDDLEPAPLPVVEAEPAPEIYADGEFAPISKVHLTTNVKRRMKLADDAVLPDQQAAETYARVYGQRMVPAYWVDYDLMVPRLAFAYHPLYFEDPNLERCGNSFGCILQPIASGAYFFANVAMLPGKMLVAPPCRYVCPNPDCEPCEWYSFCDNYIRQPRGWRDPLRSPCFSCRRDGCW